MGDAGAALNSKPHGGDARCPELKEKPRRSRAVMYYGVATKKWTHHQFYFDEAPDA
jgi:hypothetical protein